MRPILAVIINIIYMERTYVFNQDGAGAGNGLLASILPSLQSRGMNNRYSPGYSPSFYDEMGERRRRRANGEFY